jgi:DNA repair photolyase
MPTTVYITEACDPALPPRAADKLAHLHGLWQAGAPLIIVTKHPAALLTYNLPLTVLVHCTITGWGGSRLEPGIAAPAAELAAYQELSARYGIDRVVLRVDPVFPTGRGLERAFATLRQAVPGGRVRVSFVDLYPHVRARLAQLGIVACPWQGLHAPLGHRQDALRQMQTLVTTPIEVCAEPGLACTGCVSARDLHALGLPADDAGPSHRQRFICACLGGKREALTKFGHTCSGGCVYCYWRTP